MTTQSEITPRFAAPAVAAQSNAGASAERIGLVVIGRNEGERLKRCLRSVHGQCRLIVYVDSGSTDGSVEFAESLGVDVVNLDMTRPFTMARGRNAGFHRLRELSPELEYVQFVDGDCEVAEGWLQTAAETLAARPEIVAVCGRRRERAPEHSFFNRMCDVEWDAAPGLVRACGGDAMIRVRQLQDVGGYNEVMIAGEEGELSFRLRNAGGQILRLDREMTRHDAAMTRWSQWFNRNLRTGHAFAEGASLHGGSPEAYNVRPTCSAVVWGLLVPAVFVVALVGAMFVTAWAWLVVALCCLGYAAILVRSCAGHRRRGRSLGLSLTSAVLTVLAKVPEGLGVAKFWLHKLLGRRSRLIEYK